jgi:hypothetical protein
VLSFGVLREAGWAKIDRRHRPPYPVLFALDEGKEREELRNGTGTAIAATVG